MNLLPEWLKPPTYPTTRLQRELQEQTFNALFETSLDAIAAGHSLINLIANDPRQIEYARFIKWVRSSKERSKRLKEAKEIAAEIIVQQIIPIADDQTIIDDTARAKLRIDSRWKLAAKWNPKEYGEKSRLDIAVGELSAEDLQNYSTDDLKRMIIEGEFEVINPDQPQTDEEEENDA